MSEQPGNRLSLGHWARGVSGNPGGYSKEKRQAIARLTDLARTHTEDALKTVVGIMMDEKAPRNTRLVAAGMLLDRGHGKPAQSVDLSFDDSLSDETPVSDLERARAIAFVLAKGALSLKEKQQERATATDVQIGVPDGNG
jgi:hypothetical protein